MVYGNFLTEPQSICCEWDVHVNIGSSNSIPRKSSSHNRSSSSHHSHHHASSHKSTSHRSRSKRSRSRSRSPNHHRRSKGSSHKSKYKPSSKTRDDGGYARNSNRELPSASHLSVPVKSYRRAHSSSSDELGDLDSDPSSPPPPPPPSGSSSVTSKAKGKVRMIFVDTIMSNSLIIF